MAEVGHLFVLVSNGFAIVALGKGGGGGRTF